MLYNLAKYRALEYPIALIFLVDFHLNWKRTRKSLTSSRIVGGTYNGPAVRFLVLVGLSIIGSMLRRVTTIFRF